MAEAPITLNQMLSTPYVSGVISRIKPAGRALTGFYRAGITDAPTEQPQVAPQRLVAYDIFDNVRTMAQARAPMVGPVTVPAQPIGQTAVTVPRFYEATAFPYEKVWGTRDLGGQYGSVNRTGRNYVNRQLNRIMTRMTGAAEFMFSRMLRGGFSYRFAGERIHLDELSATNYSFNVDFGIPAGNKTDIGGRIDALWSTSSTKIVNHMLEINKYSQLLTGYEIRHCWLNSTTFSYMLANTQLNTVRGTAVRVFDNFNPYMADTAAERRAIGFTVTFEAIPQFLWHIYDATSETSLVEQTTKTTSNNSLFIPDGKVAMTPEVEPGGWYGTATCAEIIKENDLSAPTLKEGLSSWSYPCNDPPGEELRVLMNYIPVLYIPNAVFYATVG